MPTTEETQSRLAQIPNLTLIPNAPLSEYTRFGVGGPADLLVETSVEASFMDALRVARSSGLPYTVIGGGTNLVVADSGFAGIVLRFVAQRIGRERTFVEVDAGADLQSLVDYTTFIGLKGLETMTGIPGTVGGAVYGNAGAYGHSIMERIYTVRFFDGERVRRFNNAECQFHYRESIFKSHKDWIIFSCKLNMDEAPPQELERTASAILKIRNEKYPPTMKCAGSIFKNLIWAELPVSAKSVVPAKVIREGKVPSAWFLEQAGAKGLKKGDIHVADYHANLIYNEGNGTAAEIREIVEMLKKRVYQMFGFYLEEEVQYVGF